MAALYYELSVCKDYIGRRISPQIVLNRYQRRTVANCPTTERDVISDPFQIHAGYGVDGQLIKGGWWPDIAV